MNEDVHESVASKRAVDLMRPGLIDDFIAFGPGRRVVGVREGEICDDLKAECDKAQRENRRSRAGRDAVTTTYQSEHHVSGCQCELTTQKTSLAPKPTERGSNCNVAEERVAHPKGTRELPLVDDSAEEKRHGRGVGFETFGTLGRMTECRRALLVWFKAPPGVRNCF